jgi:hypothetical protein
VFRHHRRVILLLSTVAVVFASLTTCGCTLFLSGPASDSRDELEGYGLFQRAIYDKEDGSFLGCINYSQFWLDQINDRPFMVARVFGVFSMALTVIGFICCALVMLFTKYGKSCWWGIMRMSYFFALICQVFTYSVWATEICKEFNGEETQCLAGTNGVVGSFNVLVLLTLTVLSCIVPAPYHPMLRLWYSGNPQKGPYDTEMEDDLSGIEQEQSNDDSEPTITQLYQASKSVAQSRRSAEQSSSPSEQEQSNELGMTQTHPFEASQYEADSRRSSKQSAVANSGRSEKESVSNKSRKSQASGIIHSRSVKSKQTPLAKSKEIAKSRQYTVRPKHPEQRSRQSNGSSSHDNSTRRTGVENRRSKASNKESDASSGLDADDIIEIVEEYDPPVTGSVDRGEGFTHSLGADDTEIIKFRTEYGPEGKKQIKEVTHGDGSRTVTTWIDPKGHDDDIEINTLLDEEY